MARWRIDLLAIRHGADKSKAGAAKDQEQTQRAISSTRMPAEEHGKLHGAREAMRIKLDKVLKNMIKIMNPDTSTGYNPFKMLSIRFSSASDIDGEVVL